MLLIWCLKMKLIKNISLWMGFNQKVSPVSWSNITKAKAAFFIPDIFLFCFHCKCSPLWRTRWCCHADQNNWSCHRVHTDIRFIIFTSLTNKSSSFPCIALKRECVYVEIFLRVWRLRLCVFVCCSYMFISWDSC